MLGAVEPCDIEIEISSVYTEQCYATLHLRTAELERLAASELDDKPLFEGAAKMSVAKHLVPHLTCPCPAPGCARRFAASDLLDVLSEELAGRPGELSAQETQTVETCYLRLGRPSPFGSDPTDGLSEREGRMGLPELGATPELY